MPDVKVTTRQRLLEASRRLFSSQGFCGTGLKQVVSEAQAPWGSMYHHFPGGKEQLGAETVAMAGQIDDERLRAVFEASPDPQTSIKAIFRSVARRLEDSRFREGCAVASIASDVVGHADPVEAACRQAFGAWQTTIANALKRKGLSRRDADAAAAFVLATLEGATLLARTGRTTVPLKQSAEFVDLALDQMLHKVKNPL